MLMIMIKLFFLFSEVHVVLPKFKFDSSINLNDVVKKVKKFIYAKL